jgi:hypothetical protein
VRRCACGCGQSLEGRRSQARYFDASCRKRGERKRSPGRRHDSGQRAIWKLERMDFAAVRASRARLVEIMADAPLAQIDRRKIPHLRKRDTYMGERPMTKTEFEAALDRQTDQLITAFAALCGVNPIAEAEAILEEEHEHEGDLAA